MVYHLRTLTYRVHRAKPDTVRLWTIQPKAVLDALRQNGSLLVDPTLADFSDLMEPYDWMRSQMARRLPNYTDQYPWWAYEHKVDLRSYEFGTDQQERQARLELAVPNDRVLLSAYGTWHFVMNRRFLPYSVDEIEANRESDEWDKELRQNQLDGKAPLPEPWQSRLTQSWERIFDVDDLRPTNTIQACFERLEYADLVSVTEFTPKAIKDKTR